VTLGFHDDVMRPLEEVWPEPPTIEEIMQNFSGETLNEADVGRYRIFKYMLTKSISYWSVLNLKPEPE
jgi:hypothetical protein